MQEVFRFNDFSKIISIRRKKMRKISIFVALTVIFMAGIISFSSQAFGQSTRKVLMIPREGYSTDLDLMIKMEVGVMNILLKRAGFEVDIASMSGQPILGPTQKIEKVSQLSKINLNNYVGIIMPCMAVGMFPGPPVSPETVAIVKKALADGKPVAAAANSSIILAEAGVLKGKRYAYITDPLKMSETWIKIDPRFATTDPRFEGAIYSGPGVVQDGNIITSGVCPNLERVFAVQDGTIELTQKFIAAIGPK
jgi:putative intracellular protease/amidase